MSYVLTFVASDPQRHPLLGSDLAALNIDSQGEDWLKESVALDMYVQDAVSWPAMQQYRDQLAAAKIDVFCTPRENRRKKLLVADMDSTIVVGETLDELSAFAGVKEQVEDITARAMNGEMDFHTALEQRVLLLAGLPMAAVDETFSAIQVTAGAAELVGTMRDNGAKTVLVTGGFTCFADGIGTEVGFHNVHGNQLEVQDNGLTGHVIPPILDKDSKLAYLKDYAKKLDIDLCDVMAIGDGANDLDMLAAAGLGIGYHPKPILRAKLLNVILHGDLTAALYAQGYKGL